MCWAAAAGLTIGTLQRCATRGRWLDRVHAEGFKRRQQSLAETEDPQMPRAGAVVRNRLLLAGSDAPAFALCPCALALLRKQACQSPTGRRSHVHGPCSPLPQGDQMTAVDRRHRDVGRAIARDVSAEPTFKVSIRPLAVAPYQVRSFADERGHQRAVDHDSLRWISRLQPTTPALQFLGNVVSRSSVAYLPM